MPYPFLAMLGAGGGAAGAGGLTGMMGGGLSSIMGGGAGGGMTKMLPSMFSKDGGGGMMGGGAKGGGGAGGGGGMGGLKDKLPSPGASLAMVPELFKFGMGISQALKANKLARHTQRPAYEPPKAMQNAVAQAQQLVNDTRLPGQSYMENQIQGSTANAIRAINEAGGGMAEKLAAVSGAYGGEQQAMNQLGMQAAQQQIQDVMNLQNALQSYAPFQDKQWQLNRQQPFLDTMEASRRLREGANQNIYGGLKGISSGLMLGMNKGKQGGSSATGSQSAGGGGTDVSKYLSMLGGAKKTGGAVQTPAMPKDMTPIQGGAIQAQMPAGFKSAFSY